MNDFLQSLSNAVTILFVLTTMISMGLGLTLQQVLKPLRNIRFLITALGINFIIVPLVAYLITLGISLSEPFKTGLILVSIAAGAPALPKLAQIARTNIIAAVSLMVLLVIVTIIFIPVVLPFILPGVQVNAWDIARGLLVQILLPLALAMVVRAFLPELAETLKPHLTRASSISLLLLLAVTMAANFGGVAGLFGSGGLVASLLLIAVAFVAGYFLGGPGTDYRQVQALGSSQRNIAASMVVATQNFSNDPDVLVMIVTFSAMTLIIVGPLSVIFRRRRKKTGQGKTERAGPAGGDRE